MPLDLIVSKYGMEVLEDEAPDAITEIKEQVNNLYSNEDMFKPPASGGADYSAMVIMPCTLNTAGKICNCLADNLITRSAQVMMKERRKLIIVPRETPLSTLHLKMFYELSKNGVTVVPACPGFYHFPRSLNDLDTFMVQKILNLLDIPHELMEPYKGRE